MFATGGLDETAAAEQDAAGAGDNLAFREIVAGVQGHRPIATIGNLRAIAERNPAADAGTSLQRDGSAGALNDSGSDRD